MYKPDPDDGDVLSAVLVAVSIVAAKTTMITSLKKNDAGYLFLLTLTFYKVLCAAQLTFDESFDYFECVNFHTDN
jgi:hypothetical protein